jgi:hypothetical protein
MTEHRAITLGLLILCGLGCASSLSPTVNQLVSISFGVLLVLAVVAGLVQLARHRRNYEHRRLRQAAIHSTGQLVGGRRP